MTLQASSSSNAKLMYARRKQLMFKRKRQEIRRMGPDGKGLLLANIPTPNMTSKDLILLAAINRSVK